MGDCSHRAVDEQSHSWPRHIHCTSRAHALVCPRRHPRRLHGRRTAFGDRRAAAVDSCRRVLDAERPGRRRTRSCATPAATRVPGPRRPHHQSVLPGREGRRGAHADEPRRFCRSSISTSRSPTAGNGIAGNPAFAILGHSSALTARKVSSITPTAFVFTPLDADGKPPRDYMFLAFDPGEPFLEVASFSPGRSGRELLPRAVRQGMHARRRLRPERPADAERRRRLEQRPRSTSRRRRSTTRSPTAGSATSAPARTSRYRRPADPAHAGDRGAAHALVQLATPTAARRCSPTSTRRTAPARTTADPAAH